MRTLQAELVADAHATVGEGPLWDQREQILWWVDLTGKRLHRFDPATGENTELVVEQEIGAIVPRASGGLVAAARDGFAALDADGRLSTLALVEANRDEIRMNDGKCDRAGRFWAATMAFDASAGAGALHVLEPDGSLRVTISGLTIGNGIAWTADDKTMYYIDSMTQRVDAFDFDLDKGLLGERRHLIEIAPSERPGRLRVPDGMCIDVEGCLWVAIYGAGQVCRYRPDGSLDTVVELPVENVTCPAFGGADLRDLYITTAAQHMSAEELEQQPHAGGLFRVRTDVAGTAPYPYLG
jgi:sugar lactone lactonase YvrE